ncbi:RNA polymerase sigma factor [Mucilaginibacter sp. E4BP6]|uniref:RNA polymerase sigma factor n=1 Tax=Mucilaginibacter sp. E4BP6 TaxID=2723089 RepID=UPI0015CBFDF1|nr:sigma-70 family RNA polymerase sigma factor [Mucilaginibacter sp. E4BP6]NYE67027.1 RNA polymerase sigma-70 factor (ECF subfamily) [Mucilaginibacter sp. E4BP6]
MNIAKEQPNKNIQLKEFAEWQTVYYDHLYNFASYRVNDKELIKDLIQDTFLAGIQGRNKFQQASSELTWLTAILKYKIYDVSRSKEKRSIVYVNCQHLPDLCFLASGGNKKEADAIAERLDAKSFQVEINAFVETLPNRWQQLYQFKYQLGMNSRLIQEKLNLSKSNYWIISHRLRKSLQLWYLNRQN